MVVVTDSVRQTGILARVRPMRASRASAVGAAWCDFVKAARALGVPVVVTTTSADGRARGAGAPAVRRGRWR